MSSYRFSHCANRDSFPRSSTRHIRERYGAAAELTQMIDDHVATWQSLSVPVHNDRPTSRGTMIVDWDGNMQPIVTYRRKSQEEIPISSIPPTPLASLRTKRSRFAAMVDGTKHLRLDPAPHKRKPLPSLPTDQRVGGQPNHQPPNAASSHHSPWHESNVSNTQIPSRRHAMYIKPSTQTPLAAPALSSTKLPIYEQHAQYKTTDGFTAAYLPSRFSQSIDSHRPAHIKGYDEAIKFGYDYDGRLMHVHRDADQCLSPRSTHSDCYAIDVEQYDAQSELRVQDKQVLSGPAEPGKKRGSVIRFVEKVLFKLDGLGLMKKLREERKRDKKERSWRQAGCHD